MSKRWRESVSFSASQSVAWFIMRLANGHLAPRGTTIRASGSSVAKWSPALTSGLQHDMQSHRDDPSKSLTLETHPKEVTCVL